MDMLYPILESWLVPNPRDGNPCRASHADVGPGGNILLGILGNEIKERV